MTCSDVFRFWTFLIIITIINIIFDIIFKTVNYNFTDVLVLSSLCTVLWAIRNPESIIED